jgi:uncharacterized protein YkwD
MHKKRLESVRIYHHIMTAFLTIPANVIVHIPFAFADSNSSSDSGSNSSSESSTNSHSSDKSSPHSFSSDKFSSGNNSKTSDSRSSSNKYSSESKKSSGGSSGTSAATKNNHEQTTNTSATTNTPSTGNALNEASSAHKQIAIAVVAILIVPWAALQRSYAQSDIANTILKMHNDERTSVGVSPLVWSNSLAADAKSWAD